MFVSLHSRWLVWKKMEGEHRQRGLVSRTIHTHFLHYICTLINDSLSWSEQNLVCLPCFPWQHVTYVPQQKLFVLFCQESLLWDILRNVRVNCFGELQLMLSMLWSCCSNTETLFMCLSHHCRILGGTGSSSSCSFLRYTSSSSIKSSFVGSSE